MEDLKQSIENSNLIYAAIRSFPNPVLISDEAVNDSDKTISVPSNKIWEILSINITLISTAAAGNRQIEIRFTDNSDDVIGQVIAGAVQAESLTRHYFFFPDCQSKTAFVDTDKIYNRIPRFYLPAGFKIRILDNNAVAVAADDMDIQMLVNSWDVS